MSDDGNPSRGESHSLASLRDAATSGARWVIGSQVVAEVIAFASSVALAQLITPAEFGRAAIALIIPLLAVVLSFEGFGVVLVQRAHLSRADEQTAEFLSIAFGVLSACALWFTSPIWAEPLFGARTADLIRYAAPSFAIASLGVVPRARLQRNLDFRRLSTIEVTAVVAGYAIAVGAAALVDLGAEALVAGLLARGVVETALMCRAEQLPRPRFHAAHARSIVTFGLAASLASLAWVARRNFAYILLAARLPAAQVGFYWRAYNLGAEYQEKLSGIMLRLAFPLFVRAETTEVKRLIRSRIVRINVSIGFLFLSTLIVVAPVLVTWLFGERWEPAVVPAQILAVSGMALTIMSGTEQVILATGRPRVLLGLNLLFLLALTVALLISIPHGLTAVCIATTLANLVVVAVAQVGILRRLIGMQLRQLVADLTPATISASAALAAGFAASTATDNLAALIEIAILGGVTAGIYASVFRLFFGAAWAELFTTFASVARPKSKADEPVDAVHRHATALEQGLDEQAGPDPFA